MTSLRKSQPRRTHRERSQPGARQHLGLLEKKKDFVLRRQNHLKKQKILKTLVKKSLFKNKDEFYHKMIKAKTEKGQHFLTRDKVSDDMIRLLKDQDQKYIRHQVLLNLKKIEKMKDEIQVLPFSGSHMKFESDSEESDEKSNDSTKEKDITEGTLEDSSEEEIKEKKRLGNLKLLKARMEKQEKLKVVERQLEVERMAQLKGSKKKIFKDGVVGYKFLPRRAK